MARTKSKPLPSQQLIEKIEANGLLEENAVPMPNAKIKRRYSKQTKSGNDTNSQHSPPVSQEPLDHAEVPYRVLFHPVTAAQKKRKRNQAEPASNHLDGVFLNPFGDHLKVEQSIKVIGTSSRSRQDTLAWNRLRKFRQCTGTYKTESSSKNPC